MKFETPDPDKEFKDWGLSPIDPRSGFLYPHHVHTLNTFQHLLKGAFPGYEVAIVTYLPPAQPIFIATPKPLEFIVRPSFSLTDDISIEIKAIDFENEIVLQEGVHEFCICDEVKTIFLRKKPSGR